MISWEYTVIWLKNKKIFLLLVDNHFFGCVFCGDNLRIQQFSEVLWQHYFQLILTYSYYPFGAILGIKYRRIIQGVTWQRGIVIFTKIIVANPRSTTECQQSWQFFNSIFETFNWFCSQKSSSNILQSTWYIVHGCSQQNSILHSHVKIELSFFVFLELLLIRLVFFKHL